MSSRQAHKNSNDYSDQKGNRHDRREHRVLVRARADISAPQQRAFVFVVVVGATTEHSGEATIVGENGVVAVAVAVVAVVVV